jgi:HEAT repeat protein
MIVHTIKQQIRDNFIAIISLMIAILALYHNEKLYEKSELNRNVRIAAFEVLMRLGELQQVVNNIHYDKTTSPNDRLLGWGQISLIGDLSHLIPDPVPKAAERLIEAWKENHGKIKEEASADAVSNEIDLTRQAVLEILSKLD